MDTTSLTCDWQHYVNNDMFLSAALTRVSLGEKVCAPLEHETMTITMTPPVEGRVSSFNGLKIGQVDVPIAGRSIQQCINDMKALGWIPGPSSMSPNRLGTICKFTFDRPLRRVLA